jgi:excisionase family DNA binding protein
MQDIKGPEECRKLITYKEAAHILGISSRTLYRLVDLGKTPRPVKLGTCTRFLRAEIEGYIETLKAKRPKPFGSRPDR